MGSKVVTGQMPLVLTWESPKAYNSVCFQLIPQVALRAECLESRRGQIELLKDYGEVSDGKREQ